MVITVESIINANGSLMELCFGSCFNNVVEGNSYPSVTIPFHLEIGASSIPHGNHFINSQTGSNIITYVFRFHEVDEDGDEIGTPLRISYVYDESFVGVDDEILKTSIIYPNPVKNQLTVSNATGFDISLYSILGKEILRKTNISSSEKINTSHLAEGAYFLKIYSDNASKTKKLVIIK